MRATGSTRLRARSRAVRRALVLADVVAVTAVFQLTRLVLSQSGHRAEILSSLRHVVIAIACWILLAGVYGLYSIDRTLRADATLDDTGRLFHVATIDVLLLLLLAPVVIDERMPALQGIVLWSQLFVAGCAARLLARTICRRRGSFMQRTVVLGSGKVGQEVARKLIAHSGLGIHLVGFVDPSPRPRASVLAGVPVLGSAADLPLLVRHHAVERVIVAFPRDTHVRLLDVLDELADLDIRVDLVPRLFEAIDPGTAIHPLEGIPLLALPMHGRSRGSLIAKRTFDIAFSAVALLMLAPVLVGIAVMIKLDSPGPVLFRADRIGRGGRTFRTVKFRTMRPSSDEHDFFVWLAADPARHEEFRRTHKVTGDPRVTRVGVLLRRLSLDELPQFVDVLRGDLSVIGPRPISSAEWRQLWNDPDPPVRLAAEGDGVRHRVSGYWDGRDMRPGLTGYWQVTGRSDLSYEERVRLDRSYVRGWSLRLDWAILAKTIGVVFSGRGAR